MISAALIFPYATTAFLPIQSKNTHQTAFHSKASDLGTHHDCVGVHLLLCQLHCDVLRTVPRAEEPVNSEAPLGLVQCVYPSGFSSIMYST